METRSNNHINGPVGDISVKYWAFYCTWKDGKVLGGVFYVWCFTEDVCYSCCAWSTVLSAWIVYIIARRVFLSKTFLKMSWI